MRNSIWSYVGIGLLCWIAYDLYAEYTLAWGIIYRDEDPVLYWVFVSVWAVLGISCFFSWRSEEK